MPNKGFLLVTMQPPPALEEEFNAWYDTEHIPERLAVPGILTALRFVCINGGHPRYLAMYDLESLDVMTSPAYLKVAHDKSSPWTKRVTSRVKVWRKRFKLVTASATDWIDRWLFSLLFISAVPVTAISDSVVVSNCASNDWARSASMKSNSTDRLSVWLRDFAAQAIRLAVALSSK